jgi:hypothetical protein
MMQTFKSHGEGGHFPYVQKFDLFFSWFVELILRVVQHAHLPSAAGLLPPK